MFYSTSFRTSSKAWRIRTVCLKRASGTTRYKIRFGSHGIIPPDWEAYTAYARRYFGMDPQPDLFIMSSSLRRQSGSRGPATGGGIQRVYNLCVS